MVTLEVNNLIVRLDNRLIINNISFRMDEGIMAVLGPNGVGKSTLLRSIIGTTSHLSGEVLINKKSIINMSPKEMSRLVAFIPQEHHPSFPYTVEDVVLMGRTPYVKYFGFPQPADRSIVFEIMKQLEISHLGQRNYTQLSGGERRLVLFAMALCQQTKILLLDEPTAFMDVKNSYRILSLIREIAADQKKLVIVTMHDVNHAIECADKILLMFNCEDFLFGTTTEVVNIKNLDSLYQIAFEVMKRNDGSICALPQALPRPSDSHSINFSK